MIAVQRERWHSQISDSRELSTGISHTNLAHVYWTHWNQWWQVRYLRYEILYSYSSNHAAEIVPIQEERTIDLVLIVKGLFILILNTGLSQDWVRSILGCPESNTYYKEILFRLNPELVNPISISFSTFSGFILGFLKHIHIPGLWDVPISRRGAVVELAGINNSLNSQYPTNLKTPFMSKYNNNHHASTLYTTVWSSLLIHLVLSTRLE